MYQEIQINEHKEAAVLTQTKPFSEGHLETLRSLAALLLREVEQLGDLPGVQQPGGETGAIDLYGEVQRFEKELIRQALKQTNGNQRNAAALLGTKITTLHAKIKRHGAKNFAALSKV